MKLQQIGQILNLGSVEVRARAVFMALLDERNFTLYSGPSGTWLCSGKYRCIVPKDVMDYLLEHQLIELNDEFH